MPMKSNRINWRIIIPAILLILPVVLILIFDPAAWLSKSNLVSDILGTIFICGCPYRDVSVALVQTGTFPGVALDDPVRADDTRLLGGRRRRDVDRLPDWARPGERLRHILRLCVRLGLHLADHDSHRRSLCSFPRYPETDPKTQQNKDRLK